MEFHELIDENLVFYNLDLQDKKSVIEYIANVLAEKKYVESQQLFTKAVFKREQVGVTGIGNGIAIPHGKSNCVQEPRVVVVKLKNPIEWESLDDEKVKYIFLFAIGDNPKAYLDHLRLLASFAAKLGNDEKVKDIQNAADKKELIKVLRR